MTKETQTFIETLKTLGFEPRSCRYDDGVVGHYGEKPCVGWSAVIFLWEKSISAGLCAPLLDQTIQHLFPRLQCSWPKEYRIYRAPDPRKRPHPKLQVDWIRNAVQEAATRLNAIRSPGDLAPYFAVKKLRETLPNPDWSKDCEAWIALTYLGKGVEAARQAIRDELKFSNRFGSSKLINILIELIVFHRKPQGVFKRAEAFQEALRRLDQMPESLTGTPWNDYLFSDLKVERDGSAYY